MSEFRTFMTDIFDVVKITAATGRHYALVAEKSKDGVFDTDGRRHTVVEDYRFREDGNYAVDDTHLKPWESKVDSST
jgi:hypothetical protein